MNNRAQREQNNQAKIIAIRDLDVLGCRLEYLRLWSESIDLVEVSEKLKTMREIGDVVAEDICDTLSAASLNIVAKDRERMLQQEYGDSM
jgi:hypothetical protein